MRPMSEIIRKIRGKTSSRRESVEEEYEEAIGVWVFSIVKYHLGRSDA